MSNNKDVTLKAKLAVDLKTFQEFESKVKSLAKTFKNVQIEIANSSQGMDKTIQQAFFGKRGTDRSTIKTFFKNEFKAITNAFTTELKAASNAIVAAATNSSNDATNTLANIIAAQQKKIAELSKKATRDAAKATAASAKPKKYKLTDDDKAFRDYYIAERNYIESETKKTISMIKSLNKLWERQIRRDFRRRIKELTSGQNAELAAMGDYYRAIEREQTKLAQKALKARSRVPQASFLPGEISKNIINKSGAYQDDMAAMRQHYKQESAQALKDQISMNVSAVKTLRNLDEQEYKRKVAADKAATRQHGEELMLQLKQEQQLYAEKKRLQEKQLNDAKSYLKGLYENGPMAQYLNDIKESPLKSFTTGIADGVRGLKGALTSVYEKFKMLFKVIATGTVAAVGSFIAVGAVVQKLASGVLFATEKMRGYEIALFGMMKTQDGVNQLMEKAFKVTKNLPISYEQVYQSTKAFTLIGPVRDMLKNTIETETVLKRMYSITMALSQIEPEWGLAGAQFSLREALSGDLRSLQRRFEIPVNLIYAKDGRSLRQLKNDPEAMSQALSDYFKEFYNEETLGMAANQFGAILGKIEGVWFKFQSEIGNAGFYDMFVGKLKKVRDELEAFTETLEFKEVTNKISNALGSSLDSILNIIEKLTISFGKLIGINVESSNAFQVAADVIEKFAMLLRVVERIVSETDVFGMLNNSLQKTKQFVIEIANYGLKVFRTIARDVDIFVSALEKLPDMRSMFTENTGRGLFYLWLFGPTNIMSTISGFATAAIAAVYSIKTAVGAALAANTVLSDLLGVSIAKWAGLITGTILGLEQIGGTFKFVINSVDEDIESSKFYQLYAWLTGKDTTDNMVARFESLVKRFGGASDYYSALSPVKNIGFAQSLSSVTGLPKEHIQSRMTTDPQGFLVAFLKKEGGIDQLREAIENLNIVTSKMADDDPRKMKMTRATATMDSIVNGLVSENIDFSEIAKRYMTEDQKLSMYERDYFGQLHKFKQLTMDAYDDVSKFVGNSVEAISTMLKPAISESEKALLAARRGDIMKRGDSAITNISDGAKIAGAQLLDVFKAAGLGVGVTSGFRAESVGSQHNKSGQSYAIDYQPNIGGKLISSAADVNTPEFESLVAALKANENIARVILEYKDKSIFGDKYKDIAMDMPSAKEGAVVHVQFKKDLEKSEAGVRSLFTNTIGSIEALNNIQKIFAEESGKLSPQIPKNDFLKQSFQRATEYVSNVYLPMMNYAKEDYKQITDVLSEIHGDNVTQSLYKGMEDDGMAKAGPRVIDKIKKEFANYRQNFKQYVEQAGGEMNLTIEVIGREMQQFLKTDNADVMTNPIKIITGNPLESFMRRTSNAISEVFALMNFDEISKSIEAKTLEKQEMFDAALWKDVVEKKSYEFIDILGNDIDAIRRNIYIKMIQESGTKIAYNSGFDTKSRAEYDQIMAEITSIMRLDPKLSFAEAMSNVEINNSKIKEAVVQTKNFADNINAATGALYAQRTTIENNINALKRIGSITELNARKAEFMRDKETRGEFYSTYKRLLGEGQTSSGGDAFSSGLEEGVNNFLTSFQNINNGAVELVDSMRSNFENGFFDVMNGRLEGLREVFRSVAGGIFQSVTRIIAQIAAINATKLILGIDLNTSGGFSQSGGGIVGSIGNKLFSGAVDSLFSNNGGNVFQSLVPMMSNNSTISLNPIGAASQAMTATGVGNFVSNAMTATGVGGVGNFVSNAMTGAAGAKVAGAKSGIFGNLSKWIQGNPVPALGIATGLTFLSQPGRLFGGTKDKTGAAYSQYTDLNNQRTAMIGRRGSDAISYYMGLTPERKLSTLGPGPGLMNNLIKYLSGNTISDFDFSSIGYSEWTSGDSWARGPKEKHAATDTTAYTKSVEMYYELLMDAGKKHYRKMFEINKLSETNSLESLRQQQRFDIQKLDLIKTEYERYAATSYTAADKWDKMDEYRNQQLDQEYANMQLQNEIAKTVKETKYAEMTYYTFIKSMGQDTQAMAKVALEIEKMKLAELTENTLEWYNAKMSVLQSEAELANSLKESAKATQSAIDSGLKQIYMLGRNGSVYIPGPTFVGGSKFGKTYNYSDPKATEYGEMTKKIERLKNGTFTNNDLVGASISTSTVRKQIGEEFVDMGEYKKGPFYPYQQMYKDTKYGNADYVETYMDGLNYGTYDFNKSTRTPTQSNISGAVSGKTLIPPEDVFHRTIYMKFYEDVEETTYDFGEKVFTNIQDAIDYVKEKLEKDKEHFIQTYSLQVETENIYKNIGKALDNIDSSVQDRLKYLNAVNVNYTQDSLMSEDEKEIAQAELGVEVAKFYADLGNNISQWLKEGFLSVDDVSIDAFKTAISGGLNEGAVALYEQIRVATQKTKFKSGVASTLNNMENFDAFRTVMSGEGADAFRSIMGLEKYQEAFEDTRSVLKTGTKWTPYTYRTGGLFGSRTNTNMMQSSYNYWAQEKFTNYREVDPLEGMLEQYTDPYEFYFETMKNQIQTRINNSVEDSDEWFAAQTDMFNLMIDNAVKMKEKAEEFNRSMEDMFGKIEETMRMRIAEERETSKGDVYFIDAGATRNSQKLLDDMLAKVQTNDPAARQLIEEFRKKMMGIK